MWVKSQAGLLCDVCGAGPGSDSTSVIGACNGSSVLLGRYSSEADARRILDRLEAAVVAPGAGLFVFPQAHEVVSVG